MMNLQTKKLQISKFLLLSAGCCMFSFLLISPPATLTAQDTAGMPANGFEVPADVEPRPINRLLGRGG
jgi:hypothetical protein